jgi:peptidoglycan hydrolase-like protein with peptidoglycan-binding domain
VRLNRQYRQSLGWQAYSGRIARLIGLTTSAPSEQAFAVAVAHWQQRQSGLAVDGIIGPSTWVRMRAALGPAPVINVDRAVRLNHQYRRSLGWQAYTSSILRLLGFITYIPAERGFAAAVARWQRSQGNLLVDGIIGPQTLAAMRTILEAIASFDDYDAGRALSSQELALDPVLMRQLERELEYEAQRAPEPFVTELAFGRPQGHQHLTATAAAGLPGIGTLEATALRNGVTRVDDPRLAFAPPEQRRHTLRRTVCQAVPVALSEARNHLIALHGTALSSSPRRIQFEFIGEALHLIQDSYSEAHTERQWGGPGGFHPILFIRFFGFDGSLRAPIEHQVFPPPDPRDVITVRGGSLTPWALESVRASRAFLQMMLRHLASPGSPTNAAELRAFMDWHLALSPSHTPTRFFYPHCPP